MAPRYFQGKEVYGLVSASETARTFKDVVDLLNICPRLPLTRADYLKLPKRSTEKVKGRDEVKHVPYFVAACFKESPSRRQYERATHCNLIFLDLDELGDGSCPAAPFVNDPETLYTALHGFSFAAYTTASSTPAKPRMRIVVDAEAIPISSYVRATSTVANMLGIENLTKENKVGVQPMFLPTVFSDTTEAEHPLFAFSTEGRSFTVADIGDALFPEYSDKKPAAEYSGDALFFLRAPVPEITLEIAKDALASLDPDCEYGEWIDVAAALRHQFPQDAEEAYELFDQWSQEAGARYPGEDETRKKWNSYRPTPVGRAPITIHTLLKRASAAGWNDKKVKESSFRRVERWMEEVSTITELSDEGIYRILAAPLLSATQEGMLVDKLRLEAKTRFGHKLTTADIRADIKRLRAEVKAQSKPTEKVKEPLWAKGVGYVSAAGQFYRHRTGEKYTVEQFNRAYSRHLLPTEDQLKEAGKPVTSENLAKPLVLPADYALNYLTIPTVYDYAYDPSQPTDMFFVLRGRKYVNTYSPTYPDLDPKGADAAGALFQKHLANLIGEPEYRRVLVDFIAFMVQNPGVKIRWAVLIQSSEGAGKTFIAKALEAVLGVEHVKVVDGDAIHSGYNEWSFGHQVVVLEEVRVAGTNRHEVMNALKPLITNDTISINQKFRDNRQVQNISNYIAFSNSADALALTPGDRRWFVLKSPLQNKAQVLTLGETYFVELFAMLRDRAGALRSWLDRWEISPEFRADGHAPRTKYAAEMANDTAGDLCASVRRLLLEGDYSLIQYDVVSSDALTQVLTMDEGMHKVSKQHLSAVLRDEGFVCIDRHRVGDDRHPLWMRVGMDKEKAVELARWRVKHQKKNLEMQLVYA